MKGVIGGHAMAPRFNRSPNKGTRPTRRKGTGHLAACRTARAEGAPGGEAWGGGRRSLTLAARQICRATEPPDRSKGARPTRRKRAGPPRGDSPHSRTEGCLAACRTARAECASRRSPYRACRGAPYGQEGRLTWAQCSTQKKGDAHFWLPFLARKGYTTRLLSLKALLVP